MDLRLLESNSASVPSLPDGIYYGQYESHGYINNKIYERNLADTPIKPAIDFRSLPTRNTLYPMADDRLKYKQRDFQTYDTESIFAPINTKGPFEGYNVVNESKLRNQHFALQRGAGQGTYIPSSESDLYKTEVPSNSYQMEQPFPNLFLVPHMTTNTPPTDVMDKMGQNMFFNNTKVQLRAL